jgi:HSP20 family protein
LATKEEKTFPGRFYVPNTDVYETEEALTVVMEMPGVGREEVEIGLKDDVLRVEGKIDFSKYGGMEPVYTEYRYCWRSRATTRRGRRSATPAWVRVGGPRTRRRAGRG